MRAQPFCVVLLDEIEKAEPEVFDVLLGLCDEGRLTDPLGRVTSFRSALVLLTSNLGVERTGSLGFHRDNAPDFTGAVAEFFRPEFFNRLDAVVPFAPLAPHSVAIIARKELAELNGREGLSARRLRLACSEALVEEVARAGFDQRFGARPLQRAIEQLVVAPLAEWLLPRSELRDALIEADWRGGCAVFAEKLLAPGRR